jgi:hypothetical protein
VGLFNFRNLRVAAAAQVQYTRGKSPEKKENTLGFPVGPKRRDSRRLALVPPDAGVSE